MTQPQPFNPEIPPSDVVEVYDNSKLSDFDACRRYFYLRHIKGWTTKTFKPELSFGTCWHSAMDVVWPGVCRLTKDEKPKRHDTGLAREIHSEAMKAFLLQWQEEQGPSDIENLADIAPRTPSVAEDMLWEYINERWTELSGYQLLQTERAFLIPLDFENEHPKYWYSGRIDKIIRHNGLIKIIDHKTTMAYAKEGYFRNYFTDQFFVSSQFDGYSYAGYLIYPGEYNGDVWADCALVHKTVHHGFKTIRANRPLVALDGWRWETIDKINDVRLNQHASETQHEEANADYQYSFRKNTGNCFKYMRACTFFDICQGLANPLAEQAPPPGFVKEFWNPLDEDDMKQLKIDANALVFYHEE